jgi:hypothetical protein
MMIMIAAIIVVMIIVVGTIFTVMEITAVISTEARTRTDDGGAGSRSSIGRQKLREDFAILDIEMHYLGVCGIIAFFGSWRARHDSNV